MDFCLFFEESFLDHRKLTIKKIGVDACKSICKVKLNLPSRCFFLVKQTFLLLLN